MAYFIKQIQNNKFNHYKYNYLDHLTTVIDIKNNYWSFAMDLFTINDFSLPINSLAANLQLPFQTIENIAFNLSSDQSLAKESVEHNKDYCRIYSGNFCVDVSQNEIFKQDLENFKLNFELSLFIDPEAAKGGGTDIKQDDLDNLINETSEQRWDFVSYYTNTHQIQQSGFIQNITGYSLPFGNICVPKSRQLNVNCNLLKDLNSAFNSLVTINSLSDFQILTAKVKFYYWLELDMKVKNLEKVLQIDRTPTKELTINFEDCTIFDYKNNEVIVDPIGVKGFNIPQYSQGYYEIELQILQDDAISKMIVKNYFNFIEHVNEPYISIASKTITSLNGFKEVKF